MRVDLVSTLKLIAEGTGRPLARLSATPDRYGPLDALLLTPAGYVTVRTTADRVYEIMVWGSREDLFAWGHTVSTDDIVETMQRWQAGSSLDAVPHLTLVDETTMAAALEALWQVVLRHDNDGLARIASAAVRESTLRRLRPWVGHGTLHLLHADDHIDGVRLGLAFHPAGGERWQVNIYNGELSPVVDDAHAVSFASQAAAAW